MMLSDMCLSVVHIGPRSRTERRRKTTIGKEVAHVKRDSDNTLNVNVQGHQTVFVTALFTHQAAPVVTVGT